MDTQTRQRRIELRMPPVCPARPRAPVKDLPLYACARLRSMLQARLIERARTALDGDDARMLAVLDPAALNAARQVA